MIGAVEIDPRITRITRSRPSERRRLRAPADAPGRRFRSRRSCAPKATQGYAVFIAEGSGDERIARARRVELGDVRGNTWP